jgi:transposase
MQIDTVMGWHDEYEKRGEESFTVRFSPGRPPRLMERDLKRLGFLLLKGSVANGYRTEIWTTKRIAEVIAREWRVGYHPDHIGRLMAKHGWTRQKPARRAAVRLGALLAFVNESGFLLIPAVRKTWAPRGITPVCRHPLRREKVSGISAVTVSPQKKWVGL